MKFSLSGPSLFLHHRLSTRSGFVRIEEPDMLLADHPYRHLSTSRICQPPPPINEDVIDRCHATDDGFHSMDVRYTSDSSDGANNTYGLEIGDKDFDVRDSSDKTCSRRTDTINPGWNARPPPGWRKQALKWSLSTGVATPRTQDHQDNTSVPVPDIDLGLEIKREDQAARIQSLEEKICKLKLILYFRF